MSLQKTKLSLLACACCNGLECFCLLISRSPPQCDVRRPVPGPGCPNFSRDTTGARFFDARLTPKQVDLTKILHQRGIEPGTFLSAGECLNFYLIYNSTCQVPAYSLDDNNLHTAIAMLKVANIHHEGRGEGQEVIPG